VASQKQPLPQLCTAELDCTAELELASGPATPEASPRPAATPERARTNVRMQRSESFRRLSSNEYEAAEPSGVQEPPAVSASLAALRGARIHTSAKRSRGPLGGPRIRQVPSLLPPSIPVWGADRRACEGEDDAIEGEGGDSSLASLNDTVVAAPAAVPAAASAAASPWPRSHAPSGHAAAHDSAAASASWAASELDEPPRRASCFPCLRSRPLRQPEAARAPQRPKANEREEAAAAVTQPNILEPWLSGQDLHALDLDSSTTLDKGGTQEPTNMLCPWITHEDLRALDLDASIKPERTCSDAGWSVESRAVQNPVPWEEEEEVVVEGGSGRGRAAGAAEAGKDGKGTRFQKLWVEPFERLEGSSGSTASASLSPAVQAPLRRY